MAGLDAPLAVPPAPHGVRPLADSEFRHVQRLVHAQAGIHLSDQKRALVVSRLSRRVRELGLASFGQYARLTETDPAELIRLLDAIATNETRFFREGAQFEFLERRVYPEWLAAGERGTRPRRVRVWSAACSTGEEPYSLAMSLLHAFPREAGWSVEVLASDISTKALAAARAGVWPLERAKDIPERLLKRFMQRGVGSQEGRMRASAALREVIRFERVNLSAESYPVAEGFDLIFCRNVLIYFTPADKLTVVNRLARHLAPTGYFLLGHAESLLGATDRLRFAGPMIYAAHGAPALRPA